MGSGNGQRERGREKENDKETEERLVSMKEGSERDGVAEKGTGENGGQHWRLDNVTDREALFDMNVGLDLLTSFLCHCPLFSYTLLWVKICFS